MFLAESFRKLLNIVNEASNEQRNGSVNLAVIINTGAGATGISRVSGKEYKSGAWVLSDNMAQRLQGGMFTVHSKQDALPHHGGKIIKVEKVGQDGSHPEGRYVIYYSTYGISSKEELEKMIPNPRTLRWAQEKAYW